MVEARIPSVQWDEETAAAISRARSERWALMLHLSAHPYDVSIWRRVHHLQKELYKLTGFEIYNPLNHEKLAAS